MRLDRFLSERTSYSRRELKDIITHGKVTVNGAVVKSAQTAVKESDTVVLEGKKIDTEEFIYVLMNKPKGYVTSLNEPGQKSVMELIPEEYYRKALAPVGRLDKDSTGLLLFTDDGQFAHQMLSVKGHVNKYYKVTLARPWEEEYAQRLQQGLVLSDGTECLSAQAEKIPGTERQALICLREGKYHEVRRMFAALGNHVEELDRVAIGGLCVDEFLTIGLCKMLKNQDIQKILENQVNFSSLLQSLSFTSS